MPVGTRVAEVPRPEPVFVFGITQRTGTHFLAEALARHPDCCDVIAPTHEWQPRWEHALNEQMPLLDAYVETASRTWHKEYRTERAVTTLRCSIGNGLRAFLASMGTTPDERVVVKQPTVHNLDLFLRFLPDARPIVLVRDGRAVVESGVRGFGWSYERGIRVWAHGAQTLLRIVAEPANAQRIHVIRYEDLVAEPATALREIFAFVGLNPDTFDYDGLAAIPRRGSSYAADNKVSWNARDDPPQVNRSIGWPSRRVRRFDHLAGHEARSFGYDAGPSARRRARLAGAGQGSIDAAWGLARAARRMRDTARGVNKAWHGTRHV